MDIETLTLGPVDTNCYLLTDKETGNAIVIDPADRGEEIYERVRTSGCAIRLILLTHGHFDHIGGADELSKLSGAPIYVHSLDAELLSDAEKNISLPLHGQAVVCNTPPLIFENGAAFEAGNIKLTAVHTPGHTRGSVCYIASDCVFTGDTVFSNGYGRTDLYGGSHAVIYKTLMQILPLLKGKRAYPGHGDHRDF